MALRAGIWSIIECRSPAALIVAADSWVSAGCVRDLLRMSGGGPITDPGEAGVALLIEPMRSAISRGAPVLAELALGGGGAAPAEPSHHAMLGDCQAADALLALAMRIRQGAGEASFVACEVDQVPVNIGVRSSDSASCYPSVDKDENDV